MQKLCEKNILRHFLKPANYKLIWPHESETNRKRIDHYIVILFDCIDI